MRNFIIFLNYFLDFIYAQQCTDVGKNLLNKLKFYGKHIMTNKKVIYNIEEYFDPIKYSHIFLFVIVNIIHKLF